MGARIISADEARELLDGTTNGPWSDVRVGRDGNGNARSHEHQLCNDAGEAVAIVTHDGSETALANDRLHGAAPDLAHTVVALSEVVDAVRAEHAARVAWLASLPPGACTSPPTQALLDAEERTRGLLTALGTSDVSGSTSAQRQTIEAQNATIATLTDELDARDKAIVSVLGDLDGEHMPDCDTYQCGRRPCLLARVRSTLEGAR